jgi:hypothetical protein
MQEGVRKGWLYAGRHLMRVVVVKSGDRIM